MLKPILGLFGRPKATKKKGTKKASKATVAQQTKQLRAAKKKSTKAAHGCEFC